MRPVVAIFTRDVSDNLAGLVKQVDEAVAKNKEKDMAAYVVVLTDDKEAAESKLKKFAKKHKIENTPLTIAEDGAAGPESYNLSEDAQVTVLLYSQMKVRANHAFGEGELDKDAVAKVMKDTSKILE